MSKAIQNVVILFNQLCRVVSVSNRQCQYNAIASYRALRLVLLFHVDNVS